MSTFIARDPINLNGQCAERWAGRGGGRREIEAIKRRDREKEKKVTEKKKESRSGIEPRSFRLPA